MDEHEPARWRKRPVVVTAQRMREAFAVETMEGTMRGKPGDWLITGVDGEQYPCDNSIFRRTYERGDEQTQTRGDGGHARPATTGKEAAMTKADFIPVHQRPVIFLDVETTHIEPGDNAGEILEIAIVALDGRTLVHEKILPEHIETATEEALEINGYDKEVWAQQAVSFNEVAHRVKSLMSGSVIVGQNPPFDRGFVLHHLRKLGLDVSEISYHTIDTATLTWEHLTPPCGSVSLGWSCRALGISNEGAHTALADVLRCRKVYLKLMRATWAHRLWWRIASLWRLKKKDK